MAYRTVNLKPETYERLLHYRIAGRSFDDAVNLLMDATTPQQAYEMIMAIIEKEKGKAPAHARVTFRRLDGTKPGQKTDKSG